MSQQPVNLPKVGSGACLSSDLYNAANQNQLERNRDCVLGDSDETTFNSLSADGFAFAIGFRLDA